MGLGGLTIALGLRPWYYRGMVTMDLQSLLRDVEGTSVSRMVEEARVLEQARAIERINRLAVRAELPPTQQEPQDE